MNAIAFDKDSAIRALKERLSTLSSHVKGVLLFGSIPRNETAKKSDVDLLILHEELNTKDLVERRRAIYKEAKELVQGLFPLTVIDMELKDFLKPKNITPLLLNIYWDAIVVVDRTGNLQEFLDTIREKIRKSGLVRAKDRRSYYWILPKPMEKVEIL
ncbi:MAG: nucleotidyltransferase domain-containing protein [Nitrososphaeria archaeon]